MVLCTECYIQQHNQTLMLYRNKKKNDINQGKWIGLGGKFEPGESPEQCLLREIREEAGVTLTDYRLRGITTFVAQESDPMYLFVYTAGAYEGEIGVCDEGTLSWIDNDKIHALSLWEGDRLLWQWLLTDERFFSARFEYNGEVLAQHSVTFYGEDIDT